MSEAKNIEFDPASFLSDVLGTTGLIEPGHFSDVPRVTKPELADAAELSPDALSSSARQAAPVTQARLRELAEIVNRVCRGARRS
jgi:hypothetical protein